MAEPFIHLAGVKKVYRTRGAEFLAVSEATFDVDAGRAGLRWSAPPAAARPRC